MMKRIAKYFFQGLLVLIPVVVTVYLVVVVFQTFNDLLFAHIARHLPSTLPSWLSTTLGVIISLAVITGVGLLASNFIGRKLVQLIEFVFERLPLVKLLYTSVKDLLGAFVGDKKSFDKPVVVSLHGADGPKVMGFITADDLAFLGVQDHVAVYLPQSYNFAGNILLYPAARVQPLDAASSDVMTFLVSGGVSTKKTEHADTP